MKLKRFKRGVNVAKQSIFKIYFNSNCFFITDNSIITVNTDGIQWNENSKNTH